MINFIKQSALPLFLFALLAGCSSGQLSSLTTTEEKKNVEAVVLNEKGLPSMADLMKTGALPEKSLGKADAPVTIIEYMSLTCPHCRAFHQNTFPVLKRDYIDKGKVRYIMREFPIGRSAGNAAIVARCGSKDRTFQMVDLFLNNQLKWVSQDVRLDAIFNVAKKSGLTKAEFDHCLQDKTLVDNLNWVKMRGRKLGVSGTPTFFINGEKVRKPLSVKELKAYIAAHSG